MIVIDPGASGGIVYSKAGKLIAISMPKTKGEILQTLRDAQAATPLCDGSVVDCYLETLVKFAGRNMPSSAMATYAGNHGYIEGAAMALGCRVILVPPKKWQAALGLGGSKAHANRNAWKRHLKERAEQLFPDIKVTLLNCDALLMYEAARKGLL